MRDGVDIACDVHLPDRMEQGRKLPAILHQTRYHRSMELRQPFKLFNRDRPLDHTRLHFRTRRLFLDNGYAWVDMDVRGSGASSGCWICPWSPDEILDGNEMVSWITSQPWSNGRVGGTGISYDGTSAEMLLINKHPAVHAVAVRFGCFDTYTDVAFPGGIHASWFTRRWQEINSALDRNDPFEISGRWAIPFIKGVTPVGTDRDRSRLKAALADHQKNVDLHEEAKTITFRDDISPSDLVHGSGRTQKLAGEPPEVCGSLGVFSPHSFIRDIQESGAAIYGFSGWFDGGYAHAAIKRFLTVRTPKSRIIIGPWNHCGGWNCNQSQRIRRTDFDHDLELLRFFDAHLKDGVGSPEDVKPIRYFTMVEERWKEADTWPVPGARTETLYLSSGRRLLPERPAEPDSSDEHQVDPTATTGEKNRWKCLVLPDKPVRYGNRRREDRKLLTYDSDPLDSELEVTGHPVVTLHVSSSARDGYFLAYLEDVLPNGRVALVTDGGLRAIHRKLSDEEPPYAHVVPYRTFMRKDAMPLVPGEPAELVFDLQPTSYLFKRGHRIRLALAGADAALFTDLEETPPMLRFFRDAARPSRIDLPVIRRP